MKEQLFDIQRRVVAFKTTESWQSIPHAGAVIELDVTEVQTLVERLKDHPDYTQTPVTMNSMMLKIIAEGFKTTPELMSQISYNKGNNTGVRHYLDSLDIAVPMLASCNRMITPILRNADKLSLKEICQAMEDLKRRARNTEVDLLLLEAAFRDTWQRIGRLQFITVLRRLWANFMGNGKLELPPRSERQRYYALPATERLTADDLFGACTLVSNFGSVMPELPAWGALLEIIPPHVTAIALAGVRKQPKIVTDPSGEDVVAIRQVLPVTMYVDHRALDFEHCVLCLKRMVELCATPEELV